MSQSLNSAIAVIGIDIGKNSFHVVGLDDRGAILFAELQDPVRQMFRRSGLLDRVGEDRLFSTVDDGVHDYLTRHPEVSRVGV
jgi:STAS domain